MRTLLAWLPNAYPHQRADAVNALARAYLHCGMPPDARADAELALTRALDDSEPIVRRALAEAFASAREAPRHIVLALAADVSEVSRAVLAHSPLLGDADLVDCAAIGDAASQRAIARRARLAPPVAAALAEIGERAAVLALLGNAGAALGALALWRILERFPSDAEMRQRLVERPGASAALRAAVAAATAAGAAEIAVGSRWLAPRRADRVARDGREQAFVAIAGACPAHEWAELVGWLRGAGHLTVALFVRALAGGDLALVTHGLADMAGLPPPRVAGLVREAAGQGFAALYARAGLPAHLLPAFRIAVSCAVEAGGAGVGVNTALTMKMLRALEARQDAAPCPLAAVLWRLASEGARADAREIEALALADEAYVEAAAPALEADAPAVLLLAEPVNENFAPPVALEASELVAA